MSLSRVVSYVWCASGSEALVSLIVCMWLLSIITMCMCVVVPGVPKRCMRLTVLCSFVVWLSKYCMHWCGRYPVLLFRMCVMLA